MDTDNGSAMVVEEGADEVTRLRMQLSTSQRELLKSQQEAMKRLGESDSQSQETVIINGKQYVLSLTGFSQDNQTGNQFITLGNQANICQLQGKFVEVR